MNFKNSIGGKLVISLVGVIVVVIVLQIVAFQIFMSKMATEKADLTKNKITKEIQMKAKDKLDLMGTNAIMLAHNDKIIEAFEKNDYTIAENKLKSVLKEFESFDFKGTRFHLIRADMTTLYRSYSDKRDDDVSFRVFIKKAVSDKKTIIGSEIGKGGVQLRAISPVFSKSGSFIGLVELQMGLGSISRVFKNDKVYYMLLVDKKVVDEAEFKKSSSDIEIAGQYFTAHAKWFDEETVNFVKSVDFKEMMQKGYVLNSQLFASYADALDYAGNKYGIEFFGMKRADFDEGFTGLYRLSKIMIAFMIILSVAIVVIALIMTNRFAVKPINQFANFIETLGTDLTKRFQYDKKDEIGKMGSIFNTNYLDVFHRLIRDTIKGLINEINHSANESNQKLQKARSSISNQTSQAEQIATAAEEMSQTISDIARNTASAAERSADAMNSAAKGREVVQETVITIEKVKDVTDKLSSLIEALNNRSAEIGEIVTVIKDIADQTNLLALNAAIEAARAGEQGRGFAVVADEVRKLAEKTIKATVDISEKISAIQSDASNTAHSMTEAAKEVGNATEFVKTVDNALSDIYDAVQRVRDEITQISASVDEQSSTAEEVAKNIERSSALSKDIDAMAEEIVRQFDSLKQSAEKLSQSVQVFRV